MVKFNIIFWIGILFVCAWFYLTQGWLDTMFVAGGTLCAYGGTALLIRLLSDSMK